MFNETACQFAGQTCKPEVRTSGNSYKCYAYSVRDQIACYMKNILVAIRACKLFPVKFRLSELVYIMSLFFFKLLCAQS